MEEPVLAAGGGLPSLYIQEGEREGAPNGGVSASYVPARDSGPPIFESELRCGGSIIAASVTTIRPAAGPGVVGTSICGEQPANRDDGRDTRRTSRYIRHPRLNSG